MTDVAGREGYVHLTVDRIIVAAGVSRATFYQYFSDVDDCFWSAYAEHAERLVSDVNAAAAGGCVRELEVLDALVRTASSRPGVARVLMRECLAAGPIGLEHRDALIARIGCALTGSTGRESTIDLPHAILVGAVFRFLSMRLSEGGVGESVGGEVREWAGAFARRSSQLSWSDRFVTGLSSTPLRLAPGSGRIRPDGSPRERILRATATAIRDNGYRDTTVGEIAAAAGVSRRTFYNEFSSRSDAFMATYEHGFQQTLAACTPAFLSVREWPERVWHGAEAFAGFMAREHAIAYLGFVECYALGPAFALRVHDTQLAFTLFLEEGYRQRPQAALLSRACSALTAAAIFELGFQLIRRASSPRIRRMQPLAVYIALAPFIGLDAAGEFVAGKLAAKGAGAPGPA